MEIIYRPLKDLHPNPKNPRTGSESAVAELAESIKANPRFFEARPILVSDRTGRLVIIGGERRSEAAALLGMKEVPTILMTGLTEEMEDEIMVRDNSHAGQWDNKALRQLASQWNAEKVQDWLAQDDWRIDKDFTHVDEDEVNKLFEESVGDKKAKPQYVIIEFPAGEDIHTYLDKIKEFCSQWPFAKVR